MASSASSAISFESESTQEATPEYDPIAAYEACAPLHWDVGEWDFFSSEEEVDTSSTEEDSVAGGFLLGGSSEDDDDDDDEGTEDSSGFSSGSDDDGSDVDSDASMAPPIKRRRVSGTYWW
jgi:hypothetical protein